jgi:hypothetical protein
MARRTVIVSDLTGNEINERDAAQLIINYSDARRGRVVLTSTRRRLTIWQRKAPGRRGAGASQRSQPRTRNGG